MKDGERIAPSVMGGPPRTGRRRRRDPGEELTCSKCFVRFLMRDNPKSYGLWCRACTTAYDRARHEANRDERNTANKERYRLRQALAAVKDRVLLRLAREDPEHFADVWDEETE